ncbi:MAG: lytic murein transglycosylase [Desulfobulbaceae bacterium]|nr:lytic murein transglycosylase [Desulfobulbaceae bacterium]
MTRLTKTTYPLILSLLIWGLLPSLLHAEPTKDDQSKVAPLAADLVTDGQPIALDSERYKVLFAELHSKYGFRKEELEKTFGGVTIHKRVLELMDKQWESRPWYDYYPRFLTTRNIMEGRKQLRRYQELLDKIEKELGVEREIVVAIWGIESRFGQNKGDYNLFRTLNTMFDAYPRRSDFYRNQLIDFLLLCRENNIDPRAVNGSYGGAFGQTQFIPSSFQEYAVDFDHDGRRDVWSSVPDVLASIANYLHRYGWTFGSPIYVDIGPELHDTKLVEIFKKGRKGMVGWQEVAALQKVNLPPPPGGKDLSIVGLEQRDGGMLYLAGYPNLQAITKWNNSNRYAVAVAQLAQLLKE